QRRARPAYSVRHEDLKDPWLAADPRRNPRSQVESITLLATLEGRSRRAAQDRTGPPGSGHLLPPSGQRRARLRQEPAHYALGMAYAQRRIDRTTSCRPPTYVGAAKTEADERYRAPARRHRIGRPPGRAEWETLCESASYVFSTNTLPKARP